MRSLYKGVIGFGLVSIPIQVYKAMDDEKVEIHWLHKVCGSRIQYRKYCPICHVEVEPGEIVRGAPVPDGRYVVLEDQDIIQSSKDHNVTIMSFHLLDAIDPVYFRQAYWLKPLPGGHKAYRLLAETMQDTHLVALAELTLRSKPSLAVVRTFHSSTLMMHTLYFPESLREEGKNFGDVSVQISDKERDMAIMLVKQMQEPFVPERYPNEAKRELLERIQALMPSAITPEETHTTREVMSLMEQLRASVSQTAQRV
ncbi:Ku protein [Sulfobacillus thermosulfidooxidans]|uniref:non-homologous end joining protein Ku n=1 Tax=Sulfobacillus thermosulfidooxidans TaxID=28034 RepID=UPI000408B7AB|nr:Ku protein [Sulfobacillus thermosulfidooxidans]